MTASDAPNPWAGQAGWPRGITPWAPTGPYVQDYRIRFLNRKQGVSPEGQRVGVGPELHTFKV